MRVASYCMATYWRGEILWGCLKHIARSVVPGGWELETVVCAPRGDERAAEICEEFGARLVHASFTDVGSQLDAACKAARGEVLMVTGDDDFNSPRRAEVAIGSYVLGAEFTGQRSFLFYDWESQRVARWTGPPWKTDGLCNYSADFLKAAGYWGRCDRGTAHRLRQSLFLAHMQIDASPLAGIDGDTVCTHGWRNISSDRVWPPVGCMEYLGTGQGNCYEVMGVDPGAIPTFTRQVLDQLADAYRLEMAA